MPVPMALPADPHDCPQTVRLPHEIKTSIVSFLNAREAKQIALVNREWNAAAELQLWSHAHVPPRSKEYTMHGEEETASWKRSRQCLERNPSRARAIKEVTATPATRAMDDRQLGIQMVGPNLTRWTDAYGCPDRPGEEDIEESCCTWAEMIHRSLIMQPLPLLESLTLHVNSSCVATLAALLRVTPHSTDLHLHG